jgi:hypothetical protein
MRLAALPTLALLGALTLPAFSAEHVISITNRSQSDVTSVVVRGGQVLDFRRIPSGGFRDLTVSMPDGQCATRITFAFEDVDGLVLDNYDVCNDGGVELDN